MRGKPGIVQVYTGNGKGKTTAALGLAMRALGHGMKVALIQFMKASRRYGEIKLARRLDGIEVYQFGRCSFVSRRSPAPVDIAKAQSGIRKAQALIRSGRYNIVILDEINVAMDCRLVSVRDVLEILRSRPAGTEIVLTGRNAPPAIVDFADTVSEIRPIKHHYEKGITARRGIEY